MSVQFGTWTFDGQPLAEAYYERVNHILAPYGPDARYSYSDRGVRILCYEFHTTKESCCETQPHTTPSGAILVWDGRLDNRAELIGAFGGLLAGDATDGAVVAASYQRWQTDSFAKLIGDWAIAIAIPRERSLILAKDFAGTRPLFYSVGKQGVTWSSLLDPLVLLAGQPFALDEESIAGWLSCFPASDRTPYEGICAVEPSCYVVFHDGETRIRRYWDFDPNRKLRYTKDEDYEEHFRIVFAQSVRRRLRSNAPVLAGLSGGMDSSSIVCVADDLLAAGAAETPRLDTVSYYDDSEPNWNEQPYFKKVEERRGRIGCHISLSPKPSLLTGYGCGRFALTPASSTHPTESAKQFSACLLAQGARVLLSGVGGDEALGGVPTPTPELATLLAEFQLHKLIRQMMVWAVAKRQPMLHLAANTLRSFLPVWSFGVPRLKKPSRWLRTAFVKRHLAALSGYETRLRLLGPLPSLQENLAALAMLRRQMACRTLRSDPPYEIRYPFLDRDVLEFVYAVPREQIVRPNRRRSLMRRAFAGIVPQEILDRRRKSFLSRSPITALAAEWPDLAEMTEHMFCASLGIVNPKVFRQALEMARQGQEVAIVPLLRTLALECWLSHTTAWNYLRLPVSGGSGAALPERRASAA
jgi:asparagine synthase (glutamine-hydrolysing)